jgi:hypothetical protein
MYPGQDFRASQRSEQWGQGSLSEGPGLRGQTSIQSKQVDLQSYVSSQTQLSVLNRMAGNLPHEFLPASSDPALAAGAPVFSAASPNLYFATGSPALDEIVGWVRANGIKFTDSDIFAVCGFLVTAVYECEQRMVHHPHVSQHELSLHQHTLRLSNPFAFDSTLQKVAQNAVRPIELMVNSWDSNFFNKKALREEYEAKVPGISRIDAGNRPEIARMIAQSFTLVLSLCNVENDEYYFDASKGLDTHKVSAGINVRFPDPATADVWVPGVPAEPARGRSRPPKAANLPGARLCPLANVRTKV